MRVFYIEETLDFFEKFIRVISKQRFIQMRFICNETFCTEYSHP